jgi:hypothetical protein
MKKSTEILTDVSKKAGLELIAGKSKYILMSAHQNAWQNHDISISNRSSENVAQFKCFGMAVTNQNLSQEEIKRKLNLGNARYHSVQTPSVFSSAV